MARGFFKLFSQVGKSSGRRYIKAKPDRWYPVVRCFSGKQFIDIHSCRCNQLHAVDSMQQNNFPFTVKVTLTTFLHIHLAIFFLFFFLFKNYQSFLKRQKFRLKLGDLKQFLTMHQKFFCSAIFCKRKCLNHSNKASTHAFGASSGLLVQLFAQHVRRYI